MATNLAASPDHPITLLNRISKFAPAVGWLRSYTPAFLTADLIAGLTLAAYLLPAGIGDASLAGLPGLDEKVGGIDRLRTVAQVVEDFARRENQ